MYKYATATYAIGIGKPSKEEGSEKNDNSQRRAHSRRYPLRAVVCPGLRGARLGGGLNWSHLNGGGRS